MRLANREILSQEQLKQVLQHCQVCHVAFCQENCPYVVPLNFGYQLDETGKLTLYFHGASKGTKLDMLRANPQVAFSMESGATIVTGDTPCQFSCHYQSIAGTGTALLLEDLEEKRHALNRIMEHYTAQESFSYPDAAVQNLTVFQIQVQQYSGKQNPVSRKD